jgi:hypothetical protein
MESRLSFRLANPSDAELLGRLNFQLIRFPGLRTFIGVGTGSEQRVSDVTSRLALLFPGDLLPAIYHLRFLQG